MARLQVNCPGCRQEMAVNAPDANRSLRCTRCGKEFRLGPSSPEELPQTSVTAGAGDRQVIGVPCQICRQPFGIRRDMSGQVVACPICKAKQKFQVRESAGSGTSRRDALETNESQPETAHSPAADTGSGNRDGSAARPEPEPVSPDGSAVAPARSGVSPPGSAAATKAREWLPPKYLVPEDVDEAVREVVQRQAPQGIALGIDTEKTRIHSGDRLVEVTSLTRQQKMRRRQLRVGILFLVSVAILIGLFVFLLKTPR